jgi:hypothetical protein
LLFSTLWGVASWWGVDPNPFNQNNPFWFIIAYQTLAPVSEILIAPVAMLGLTLLYLDSRVRKEGFDVELLANRLMPPTAQMMRPTSPTVLQPQVASFSAPVATRSAFPSILGLNDYAPIHAPSGPSVGLNVAEPLPAPARTAESLSNGVAPYEEAGEQTAVNFAPAEIDAPAIAPEADPAIARKVTQAEGSAARPAVKTAQRTCKWCGTEANGEDRFCRVCGSVF